MTAEPSTSVEVVSEVPEASPAKPRFDDWFARELRGFGPLGILAILVILFSKFEFFAGRSSTFVIVPLGAVLALVWAWRSGTPWSEIGLGKPKSWVATIGLGILFGCAFKCLMKALVMPLLGGPPVNQAFQFLAANRAAIPFAIFDFVVAAGFGEEMLFRAFMFERLGKLMGKEAAAKTVMVLLTSAWFGAVHYSGQGLAGAEQATIVGLAFGAIFAVTGRIWMLMVAHAAFDLTAYAMIYWGWETRVAHFFFK